MQLAPRPVICEVNFDNRSDTFAQRLYSGWGRRLRCRYFRSSTFVARGHKRTNSSLSFRIGPHGDVIRCRGQYLNTGDHLCSPFDRTIRRGPYAMKLVVLVTLFAILHSSRATIDIAELKNNAKENLQTLKETAAAQLSKISELKQTAKENLQALHKTAASELTKLVMGINLENAKKVDLFHVIPKVTKVKNLLTGEKKKEVLILDPYQAERLSHYFKHSKHRIIVHHG